MGLINFHRTRMSTAPEVLRDNEDRRALVQFPQVTKIDIPPVTPEQMKNREITVNITIKPTTDEILDALVVLVTAGLLTDEQAFEML